MMHTVRRLGQRERSGCRYRSTSYLEMRRREAKKRDFIPIPDEAGMFLTFPNERLGNHYKLNWALAGYGCPPLGHNAFYNLHHRHLRMYCEGTIGPKKEIVCNRDGENGKKYFVNDGYGSYNFGNSSTIDADQWRKVMLGVTTHIASSTNLFLTDCTIGPRGAEVRVRVISSDANASLFIKNLYHPTTSNREALDVFGPNIVVYHDSSFNSPGDLGVMATPFSVTMLMSGAAALDNTEVPILDRIADTDKKRISTQVAGILIVGGTKSLTDLQSSLSQLSAYFHQQKGVIPLTTSIVGTHDGANVLVHDPTGFLASKGPNPNLWEGTLWSANGVYSAYRGITHGNTADATPESLVWSNGNNTYVTQSQAPFVSSKQPSGIVYLVETGPFVAKGSSTQLESLSVVPKDFPFQTKGVEDFVAATKDLPVYSINIEGKDTNEVNSVLQQIANGTFVLAKFQSDQKPKKE